MIAGAPATKRAGVSMGAASIGLLIGVLLLSRMEIQAAGTAMPVREVTSFTATLKADSALSSTSRTMLRVSITGVESEKIGARGRARADALVILEGEYRFSLGEKLGIESELAAFDGSGPESFIAFTRREEIRSLGFSSPLWAFRARIRDCAHRSLEKAGYPASALLEALLIGGREDVPDDLARGFERTGSQHILALSGLHAAVLYAVAAGFLGFFRNRRLTFFAAAAALVFYQFVAGPIPSLLRATLMLSIGGAAALLDRDREPLNLLCLSGMIILIADPYQAWSLSFQLSFLAILGILAAAPMVSRALDGKIPPVILAPLALSASAQLATLPVLSAFGVYYSSGIIAGLVLVPLTTVFLWMGLAWLIVSPVFGGAIHQAAAVLFDGVYRCILGTTDLLSRLPAVEFRPEAAPLIACITGAALAVFCFLPRRGAA